MQKVMIMLMTRIGGRGCTGIYTAHAPKRERRSGMGYKICPHCGAYPDPGEKCDCQDDAAALQQGRSSRGHQPDPDEHNQINHNKKEEIYHE